MRIPDFSEFVASVDIEELRELAGVGNSPTLRVFQLDFSDKAAVSNFFNQYRQEIFNSDEQLIMAYLSLYHRWFQSVLSGD